LESRRGNR